MLEPHIKCVHIVGVSVVMYVNQVLLVCLGSYALRDAKNHIMANEYVKAGKAEKCFLGNISIHKL